MKGYVYKNKDPNTISLCTEGFLTKKHKKTDWYISKRVGMIVCKLTNLDGWIFHSGKVKRVGSTPFHEEILLCSPKHNLKFEYKSKSCFDYK